MVYIYIQMNNIYVEKQKTRKKHWKTSIEMRYRDKGRYRDKDTGKDRGKAMGKEYRKKQKKRMRNINSCTKRQIKIQKSDRE